tara:strand:+ start:1028 stop:2263 length:1236 start_codon:yes stop_codon:yes gene_type:complete
MLLGLFSSLTLFASKGDPQNLNPVPVGVAKVQELAVKNPIQLSGTVLPKTISRLAAEVEGRVEKILFNEGAFVKKGKLLIQIRTEPLKLQLALALANRKQIVNMLKELKSGTRKEELSASKAAMERSQAALKLSSIELKRQKELYGDGVISLNEFDRTRTLKAEAQALYNEKKANYEEALAGPRLEKIQREIANLQAAEERIRIIEDKIDRASIHAPFTGYIAKKETEVGEWLDAGDSALVLVTVDPVLIEVSLPQSYLQHIQLGTTAEVILENNRLGKGVKIFKGKVVEIIVFGDALSRTFPVRIGIRNQKRTLAPGMMVTTKLFPRRDSQKSLFVPKDAIVRSPKETIVWAVRNNLKEVKAVRIPVKTGRAKKRLIAVEPLKGNLKKGDQVVVQGNERLRPNSAVLIQK